jgi:hypothetical protein
MSHLDPSVPKDSSAQDAELVPDPQPVSHDAQDVDAQAQTSARKPRGFATLDAAGTAHEFTSDEAREAGRKGGRATHEKRRKESAARTGGESR